VSHDFEVAESHCFVMEITRGAPIFPGLDSGVVLMTYSRPVYSFMLIHDGRTTSSLIPKVPVVVLSLVALHLPNLTGAKGDGKVPCISHI